MGCKNLEKHIENIGKFGVPVVVAINDYVTDTEKEHTAIINYCKNLGVQCKISSHWEKGGEGAADLAEEVAKIADSNSAEFKTLYDNKMSLWDKTKYVAQNIYGAQDMSDDEIIGLKSTSIKFKNNIKLFVGASYFFTTIILILLLINTININLANLFFLLFILSLVLQIFKFNKDKPITCLNVFKSNNLSGFLLFLGLYFLD